MPSCGTHDRYTAGCRGCQRSNRTYDRRRRHAIADGTWLHAVPVEEIRPVVERLLRKRMTQEGIARCADVSRMTIRRIYYRETNWVTGETAARIRAVVPAPTPPAGFVDITAPRRMVRALAVVGFSLTWQVERSGVARSTLRRVRGDKVDAREASQYVAGDVAAAIKHMYDRVPPGSDERSVSAAGWARKRGWHGPMAWDDDTIGDPRAKPYDESKSRRTDVLGSKVQDGIAGVITYDQLTTAERIIVVSRLAGQGWTAERIGEWLAWGDTDYYCRINVTAFMNRNGITSPERARLIAFTHMEQIKAYTGDAA